LKKNSNVQTNCDPAGKPGKARGSVQRDTKEVMAELVAKLSQGLEPRAAPSGEGRQQGMPGPNRERLTVGVEQLLHFGFNGEKLTEGQVQTTRPDFAEFFQSLAAARVVMEVGTHSAWARDVVVGCGHEVLVANPRQMEGPKRPKRKNDRIDAHKLARVGRMDPQSLFPIHHRSVGVRVRGEFINHAAIGVWYNPRQCFCQRYEAKLIGDARLPESGRRPSNPACVRCSLKYV
jgi:hypothetical protein